jgi:Domain of unknown function (DUF4389)
MSNGQDWQGGGVPPPEPRPEQPSSEQPSSEQPSSEQPSSEQNPPGEPGASEPTADQPTAEAADFPGAAPPASGPPTGEAPLGAPLPIAPPLPSAPPPPAMWPAAPVQPRGSGRYPVDIGVDTPDRIARWRPLVQWILALPLWIVLYFFRIVAQVCIFFGWFVALFTGNLPESFGSLIAGYYRLYWRATAYSSFLTTKYPSFGEVMGYEEASNDAAWFEAHRPEKLSRLAVLFRIILVIPQLIALLFVFIALAIVEIVAFFAVIIAGRWNPGMRDFVVGANRWSLRVDAWFSLLADPYPPFSLT